MQGVIVLTTTPDLKSANKLAKRLVTHKLAACVSMKSGFVSIYFWKGKLEKTKEVFLLIKTLKQHFPQVKKMIQKEHPYDVPEVLAIPVLSASPEYLSWMKEVLK